MKTSNLKKAFFTGLILFNAISKTSEKVSDQSAVEPTVEQKIETLKNTIQQDQLLLIKALAVSKVLNNRLNTINQVELTATDLVKIDFSAEVAETKAQINKINNYVVWLNEIIKQSKAELAQLEQAKNGTRQSLAEQEILLD